MDYTWFNIGFLINNQCFYISLSLLTLNGKLIIISHYNFIPKGDLWVQSPVIIIGNIRHDRRRLTEAYRRVMSSWPSMMVGTADGDLPKLFSPALLA